MIYELHKVDKIRNLLRDFLADKIDADEFIGRYMELWRQIRDEQWDAVDAIPGMNEILNVLGKSKLSGLISADEYISEWQKLVEKITGCEVKVGTEVNKSLDHLFGECNAYEPDPESREIYQIGELELREETRKTLDVLTAG